MTDHTQAFRDFRGRSAPSRDAELTVSIRPLTADDHAFARATFRESYRHSSAALARMPWPAYKHALGPRIAECVGTSKLLGAVTPDNWIIGWIAFVPGNRVDTVHWAYTREKQRRRGVLAALVTAAELGARICYTHKGARERFHRGTVGHHPDAVRSTVRGTSLDEPIADWLRSLGKSVVYEPYESWRT